MLKRVEAILKKEHIEWATNTLELRNGNIQVGYGPSNSAHVH